MSHCLSEIRHRDADIMENLFISAYTATWYNSLWDKTAVNPCTGCGVRTTDGDCIYCRYYTPTDKMLSYAAEIRRGVGRNTMAPGGYMPSGFAIIDFSVTIRSECLGMSHYRIVGGKLGFAKIYLEGTC